MSIGERLIECWYGERAATHGLRCLGLLPISWLYGLGVALRRALYVHGWLSVTRLPVPVVVVGNVTVGGTGKTPLVIWLAQRLRAAGYHPGVISRGYGGKAEAPREVLPDSDAAELGDEPVLIARRMGIPVWVGRRRAAVAAALLRHHGEVDVLIADDGLQHYGLGRDIEIAVVDGDRGLGNGALLPAGPLREPARRLDKVDAVVINGGSSQAVSTGAPVFRMQLIGSRFCNLQDPALVVSGAYFEGRETHVLAGIGNPARFFKAVEGLGVIGRRHSFPDHHAFRPGDLPGATLIMTEKDAVKCASHASADAWFLPVDAVLEEGLETLILERLKVHHGQQAA